jgi:hypothetical protein
MTEKSEFDSRQEKEIILFSTKSRLVLGPTKSSIRWGHGSFSPGVKWPGHEDDHSLTSTAETEKCGVTPPLPHGPSWTRA